MTEPEAGTATILFTDVVGSTEMRSRLGDIEADMIRRRHDELMTAAVTKHGGTMVKGLGDGIMAAFGATAEAVHAADDIQREVDRANRQARDDRRIEVRVGLSAGDVSWEDGDCHGTPVVTAARLCDRAEGGQILCDDLVRGLARGHTELSFDLVGEVELKGLPEPVMTYEVPWAMVTASTSTLPAPLRKNPGELPFAARASERLQLADAWKRAQVDGTTVVLLAGEPGIGKTRLSSEVARQAHDDGALVVLGRCDEHVAAAYAPWTELLRSVVTGIDDQVLGDHVARHGGEIARLVPDLARRWPDLPAPASTDPDTERLLLFDAVVDLLEVAAGPQPVFALVDDAHWADAGSVHLLRHVVSHLEPDAHVLVLVTYRDTDIDRGHALAGALADLYRAAGAQRISLRGLDEPDLQDFLTVAGGHPLEPAGLALAKRLAAETDGNPFFVTEVLRHLVETGTIVQEDGVWVGTVAPGEAGLPEGVRDVVGQRLSRMPDETNDLLRTAAVVGREFDIGLVAEIMGIEEDTAVDQLDEAITAQLVDEVEGSVDVFSFAHALVRQTLLEELTTNKRVRLHRKIAGILDDRPATPIDLLAHHYLEAAVAGVAPRAVEVACEAAYQSANRFAWEDAIRLYERALDAMDTIDPDDPGGRAEILSELARAQHGLGDADAGHQRALEAAALARRAGDAARLTQAGIAYQGELGMWSSPSDDVGADLMREGLADLGDDRPDIRARAQSALAHGLILAPGEAALAEADLAVVAAREADDHQATSHALLARAWAVRGVRPVAERLQAAEEGFDYASAHDDRYHEFGLLYHLANARLSGGDLAGAEADFEVGSTYQGALLGWAIADYRTSLALAQGRFDEAAELSDIAHELGQSLGDTNDGIHAAQRWAIARATGDSSATDRWRTEMMATAVGVALPLEATDAASDGDLARAQDLLTVWIRELQPLLPAIMRFVNIQHVSLIAFRLDSVTGLEDEVAYADRFPGELVGSDAMIMIAADTARGRFAAAQGDLDRAVTLMEAGHALHDRLGLRNLLVASGVDLGRVLLRRGGGDDRDRCRALLESIAALAEELGMAPAHAEAAELLADERPA